MLEQAHLHQESTSIKTLQVRKFIFLLFLYASIKKLSMLIYNGPQTSKRRESCQHSTYFCFQWGWQRNDRNEFSNSFVASRLARHPYPWNANVSKRLRKTRVFWKLCPTENRITDAKEWVLILFTHVLDLVLVFSATASELRNTSFSSHKSSSGKSL